MSFPSAKTQIYGRYLYKKFDLLGFITRLHKAVFMEMACGIGTTLPPPRLQYTHYIPAVLFGRFTRIGYGDFYLN